MTKDQAETKITQKHGGKRPGSGRKPIDPDGTVRRLINLTAKQWAVFTQLGGSAWLRAQLNKIAHDNNT